MAVISISSLCPTGVDLFEGCESYLQELTDAELEGTTGGVSITLLPLATALTIEIAILIDAALS